MNKNVVIYTKSYCPYSKRAIAFLDRHNVKYEQVDVTYDFPTFDPVTRISGSTSVPQIFVDDEYIGGYDDILALKKAGKIEEVLGIVKE